MAYQSVGRPMTYLAVLLGTACLPVVAPAAKAPAATVPVSAEALPALMLAKLRRGEPLAPEVAAVERLTEESDSLLLVALGELYEEEAEATNPLPLLRWSHLLDRLETALDGAGRIAGILESLVIKHA